MPSLRTDKGNQWMARAIVNGKQIACKLFPAGKKYGSSWKQAKAWEEEQKATALKAFREEQEAIVLQAREQEIIAQRKIEEEQQALALQKLQEEQELLAIQEQEKEQKRLAQTKNTQAKKLKRLMDWVEKYLKHVERTMSRKTLVEKQAVMRSLLEFCEEEEIKSLEAITSGMAYEFLSQIKDERSSNVANKYRKNILAAWTWGMDFIDTFPQTVSPFRKVKPFAVTLQDRYVPPEEDVIKVLQQASGQDLVFLLTLYFTGARRGEIFRLTWSDVKLDEGKIRLSDNKAGNGQKRSRWLQMHPELIKALQWWKEIRPCEVENVFMQTQCKSYMGNPYTQRRNFMKNLCDKAEVKHFGFHAIRHKSASITFVQSGLNAAQILMGHYRATTTDRYTKSAGLYADQSDIISALGENGIGRIAGSLLNKNMTAECYA